MLWFFLINMFLRIFWYQLGAGFHNKTEVTFQCESTVSSQESESELLLAEFQHHQIYI